MVPILLQHLFDDRLHVLPDAPVDLFLWLTHVSKYVPLSYGEPRGQLPSPPGCPSPFPVKGLQVDDGGEFRAEFEEACQRLGVRLFVLPPKRPKLNGQVKRLQRSFRDEFYNRPLPSKIPEPQRELNAYPVRYNRE